MATSAEASWAVDTSVAVASLDESHTAHRVCRAVAIERRPALAGHAAFESLSVLTRLPGVQRVPPRTAQQVLAAAYPERCWLTGRQHDALLARLASLDLVGGMVDDALVGEAARVAGRVLLTRDRRAIRTYESLGVSYEFVG